MMRDDRIFTGEAPTALVLLRSNPSETAIMKALEEKGWQIRISTPEEANVICRVDPSESLIILEYGDSAHGDAIAKAIRGSPGSGAAAPILGLCSGPTGQHDPNPSQLDAVLPPESDPTDIARTVSRWWPVSLAPTRRIATILGAGPIAGMIERLGVRLEAALETLPPVSPVPGRAIDKAEAHRLAGLCGTLGFAQAHAAWLDLSLGDESALDEVRRTTRLTLAAIARGL